MRRRSTLRQLQRGIRLCGMSATAAVCMLCFFVNEARGAGVQKSVLLIHDSRSDMQGSIVVDRAIRSSLGEEFAFDLDIRSEYFEISPSPSSKEDFQVLRALLQRKYSETKIDVVVPVGVGALQFVQAYADELFRGSEIVVWGRINGLTDWNPQRPISAVVAQRMEVQIQRTVAFIRKLQPDLQRLIIVTGTSPADRNWEAAARAELRFEDRLSI